MNEDMEKRGAAYHEASHAVNAVLLSCRYERGD